MKEKILEVFPGQGGKTYDHTTPECGLLEDSLKNHSQLLALYPRFKPDYVYGYSDGINAAAVAAGCLDAETALKIVKHRGDLVRLAEEKNGIRTGMLTCLGIGRDKAHEIAEEYGVYHSNDNGPALQILSGELDKLALVAQSGKIRKGIFLPVDSQYHVKAREKESALYAQWLGNVELRDPQIPIVAATNPRVITTKEDVVDELIHQFARFISLPDAMALWGKLDIKAVLDIGPSTTSKKLITKINPALKVLAFEEGKEYWLAKLVA